MITLKLYNAFIQALVNDFVIRGYEIIKSESTDSHDFFYSPSGDGRYIPKLLSSNTGPSIHPNNSDFAKILAINYYLKDKPLNNTTINPIYIFVQNAYSVQIISSSNIEDSCISIWKIKEAVDEKPNYLGLFKAQKVSGNEFLIKHLLKLAAGIDLHYLFNPLKNKNVP